MFVLDLEFCSEKACVSSCWKIALGEPDSKFSEASAMKENILKRKNVARTRAFIKI
jgi:hypothetical protein